MIACRCCRVPIAAAGGCGICTPIKAHLVDSGETEEERASLADVSGETVAALRDMMREARKLRAGTDAAKRLAGGRAVIAVANTLAKVLEAARKLQSDGVQAVRLMSFTERAKLFVDWYLDLPPPARAGLRERMAEAEARLEVPLELPAGVS